MSPLFGSKDTKHDDRPGDAEALAEGTQLLEHACLIRGTVWSSQGGVFFTATRLGRAALAQGKVEHLLTGGTL